MNIKHSDCATCCSTKNLELHHRKPKAQGSTDDSSNLITLCEICHDAVHNAGSNLSRSMLQRIGIENRKEKQKKVAAIMANVPKDNVIFHDFRRSVFDAILSNEDLSAEFKHVVQLLNSKICDEFSATDQLKLFFVKYHPETLKIKKFSFQTRIKWLVVVLYELITDKTQQRYLTTCITQWVY